MFVKTGYGRTCHDYGLSDLYTEQECADARMYATSFESKALFKGAIFDDGYRKGCFIKNDGQMWFNFHSTGSSKSDTRNICKKGNCRFLTLLISTLIILFVLKYVHIYSYNILISVCVTESDCQGGRKCLNGYCSRFWIDISA